MFDQLILGFSVALQPANLLYGVIGAVVGTAVGVLPGLGTVATMALLLPMTYHVAPVSAVIMIAGIFYGAQYGGSTTAILLKVPGEEFVHHDYARRLSTGHAGPCGCRTRHERDRLIHRRHAGRHRPVLRGAHPVGVRS